MPAITTDSVKCVRRCELGPATLYFANNCYQCSPKQNCTLLVAELMPSPLNKYKRKIYTFSYRKHSNGRVVLLPYKTWRVLCTLLYYTVTLASLFTRYQNNTAMFVWFALTMVDNQSDIYKNKRIFFYSYYRTLLKIGENKHSYSSPGGGGGIDFFFFFKDSLTKIYCFECRKSLNCTWSYSSCFILSTGWPVIHGRVFLEPFKEWLAQCSVQ